LAIPIRKIGVKMKSRPIKIVKSNDGVVVYIGEVVQGGKFQVLKLSDVEAVFLSERLKSFVEESL
jgi:hypothetical protein